MGMQFANEIDLFGAKSPDVTHATIYEASFGEERVTDPNWNKLLKTALVQSFNASDGSIHERQQIISTLLKRQVLSGDASEMNYMYVPEIHGSIRREDANDVLHLVKSLAINFDKQLEIVIFVRDGVSRLWLRKNAVREALN